MKTQTEQPNIEFHFPLERETIVAKNLEEASAELLKRKQAKALKGIKQGDK